MVTTTFNDLNPVALKHYPFKVSLDKCTESCNVLSPKIFTPKETKDINVKAFTMITNKNEAKAMIKHISCDFNSTTCNSNQKQNNKTCKCECKNYHKCKKDYSWNLSTCISENNKYLKSIADTSVMKCNEILTAMKIVTTKTTNTVAKNATNKRLFYLAHRFIGNHITGNHIAIDNQYYLLSLCKKRNLKSLY